MLKKYIIALLAVEPSDYIQAAQQHFSQCAEGYILGPKNHPHITLGQFYADDKIVARIKSEALSLRDYPQPNFTGLSFIQGQQDSNFWWAELAVARTPDLMGLHNKIVHILKQENITCINDIGDLYRPHLTLARLNTVYLNTVQINNFNTTLLQSSAFNLAIGRADDLGQFIEIVT